MIALYHVLSRPFGFEIERNGAAVAQIHGNDRGEAADRLAEFLEERALSELPKCARHELAPRFEVSGSIVRLRCEEGGCSVGGPTAEDAFWFWRCRLTDVPLPVAAASLAPTTVEVVTSTPDAEAEDRNPVLPFGHVVPANANGSFPPRSDAETIADLSREKEKERLKILGMVPMSVVDGLRRQLNAANEAVRALETVVREAREEATKHAGDARIARQEADRLRDSEARIDLGALKAELAEAKAEIEARPTIATRELDEILERLRKSELAKSSALCREAELFACVEALRKSAADHHDQIERFRVSQMKARAILRTVEDENISPELIRVCVFCALTIVVKDVP